MKEVIVITTTFPYSTGEQFLETEMRYYKNYTDVKFVFMPIGDSEKMRKVDSSIGVNNLLIDYMKSAKSYKLIYFIVKSLMSKVFYKELFAIGFSNVKKLKVLFVSNIKYQIYLHVFDSFLKKNKNSKSIVFYTYWNTEATYALQNLKKKYHYKVISRIHRTDIYQEETTLKYIPLKKQFTKNIDKIYTITQSANDYLHKEYGFDYDTLELSRLGVEDNAIVSKANEKGILHIVSCSSLIEVKRVYKIVDALSSLAKQNLQTSYRWSHIGGGALHDELTDRIHKKLDSVENVFVEFKGHMENREVFEFYKDNKVDLFINVSKSEGVPVSIMEAMSCHIPIVAPDVGGVSDMILDGKSGYLLSGECMIDEIVDALKDESFYKNEKIREKSYELFLDKYHAKKNYNAFLDKIVKKEST